MWTLVCAFIGLSLVSGCAQDEIERRITLNDNFPPTKESKAIIKAYLLKDSAYLLLNSVEPATTQFSSEGRISAVVDRLGLTATSAVGLSSLGAVDGTGHNSRWDVKVRVVEKTKGRVVGVMILDCLYQDAFQDCKFKDFEFAVAFTFKPPKSVGGMSMEVPYGH